MLTDFDRHRKFWSYPRTILDLYIEYSSPHALKNEKAVIHPYLCIDKEFFTITTAIIDRSTMSDITTDTTFSVPLWRLDSFDFDFSASGFGTKLLWCLLAYGILELLFAMVVYWYWIPKLNEPKDPPIIRKFEDHNVRHKLFERMLKRQEDLCAAFDIPIGPYFTQFIRNWFFVVEEEDSGGKDEPLVCIKENGMPCKEDIDKLISWGYFNVDSSQMTEEWQQRELAKMFAMIRDRHGMGPGPKSKQKLQPVQMTIEPLDIKYRPLLVYIVFNLCRAFFGCILLCYGFRYHVASTGLPYWYRPAKSSNSQSLPLLFFHGIAPAGPSFYAPMVLWGLATGDDGKIDRPIFFFENPAVAFSLSSHAPSEEETTVGVWEAVDKHLGPTAEVATAGHSFGTCLQTYLLHSSEGHRIRQIVLLDPVSIMLSDPDVITNFVYCRNHHRNTKLHDSVPEPGAAGYVMNELFIEHFVRRQFAWYNGEFFLDDIPDHCKVIVCLADRDEILNAQKIRAHIDIFNGDKPKLPKCMRYLKETTSPKQLVYSKVESSVSTASSTSSSSSAESNRNKVEMVYWEGEGVGHGHCLFDGVAWEQVRQKMKKQEKQILKTKAL